MIERILKREPVDKMRRSLPLRWVVVAIAIVCLFAGAVMVMLQVLPKPHRQTDYLIAGGFATMISLLALFGVLLSTALKVPDPFYKRRLR